LWNSFEEIGDVPEHFGSTLRTDKDFGKSKGSGTAPASVAPDSVYILAGLVPTRV